MSELYECEIENSKSNVFQGLVTSKPGTLTPVEFVRLWHHDARLLGDFTLEQCRALTVIR